LFAAALLGLGMLPSRFWWLLVLLPISLALAQISRHVDSADDRFTVREISYHYWLVFMSAASWLLVPSASMLAVISLSWGFWLWATRSMHWSSGTTLKQTVALLQLLTATARPEKAYTVGPIV
jgi:hypothetical protein